jgi:hypothetical protein
VGLLFAGSSASTIANPIKTVYQKLKVQSVGCSGATAQDAVEIMGVQSNEVIAQAVEVKIRHEEELFTLPGVVGVGVGLGQGEVVIKVLLEKMTPELKWGLPNAVENFRVVPEVTGRFIAYWSHCECS